MGVAVQANQRLTVARGSAMLALLAALDLAAGCSRQAPAPAPLRFEVLRVAPSAGAGPEGSAAELFLNQEVTIRFSQAVDRLSITEDTVRITDERGLRVRGALRTAAQTVTFVPVAPLTAALDDGTFKPGCGYQLEIAGFPRASAVRSASGAILDCSLVRRFRAVAADHKPSPLLRAEISPFGFALDGSALGMAAGSRVLRLYFHEPPLPTTVTPDAFKVYRAPAAGEGGFEEVAPRGARLKVHDKGYARLWVVELEFDRPPVSEPGCFCVELVGDEGRVLRDANGHPPRLLVTKDDRSIELKEVVGLPLVVKVHPGERVPLLRETFGPGTVLRDVAPGAVKFEARNGRAVPLVRTQAGDGGLGVFAPRGPIDLVPGQPFDRGDGLFVSSAADGVFDFLGVFIPRGVTVRVHAGPERRVLLRACSSIRIEGELVVVGTRPGRWREEATEASAQSVIDAAGAALLAGGDILALGQIRHEPAAGDESAGSPLTLLCGGGLLLGGRIPAHTVLATEVGGQVAGTAQGGPIRVTVAPMDSAPGTRLEAAAVTEWRPVPNALEGAVEVELGGAAEGVRVEMQVALPDPSNPARPAEDDGVLGAPVPVPLLSPLAIPPAGFVRFFLRGVVEPGRPPPSLGSIIVFGA